MDELASLLKRMKKLRTKNFEQNYGESGEDSKIRYKSYNSAMNDVC